MFKLFRLTALKRLLSSADKSIQFPVILTALLAKVNWETQIYSYDIFAVNLPPACVSKTLK